MIQGVRRLGAQWVLLLAVGWALSTAARSGPPEGTIAAEMEVRREAGPVHRDLIDVTAVSTTLIAFDSEGQAVVDLRPEELLVLEAVTADLGEPRPDLSPVSPGVMRVTVVVDIENGSPFIHHQEIDVNWSRVADTWRFGAGITWPKKATRAAVVVEELVSSSWGATKVELR